MTVWKQKTPKNVYSKNDSIERKLAAINGIEDVWRFTNPSIEDLHDPYELKNMVEVRDRIVEAIHKKKKISIYADPDADGVTSTSIMHRYLSNFTDNVTYFHAQRSRGHGIEKGMHLIPEGTELLLIIDSSTNSTDECKKLQKDGLDVVIIDHHEYEKDNPYAVIVNPMLDEYPNKSISGAGLTWKMCKVLDECFNANYADDYLDIVAVGMIADMMDMSIVENRYIVGEGINNFKNPGLIALLKEKKKNPPYINSTDIAYTVSPMLGACTRKDRLELALEILTCDDPKRCTELAKEINELNEERKQNQTDFAKRFEHKVDPNANVIIIIDDKISKGYSGLVANQLAQLYQKPVLILVRDKDLYNGSFRSYGGFPLKDYFATLPQVTHYGGHAEAGGISVPVDRIKDFILAANEGLKDVKFEKVIEYDLELDAKEITEDLIHKVKRFYKVSGKNFPEAKFLVKNLFVVDRQLLGEKQETLKVECDMLELMKFKTDSEYCNSIPIFANIEAVGTLNQNVFFKGRGRPPEKTNQLYLEEFRVVG